MGVEGEVSNFDGINSGLPEVGKRLAIAPKALKYAKGAQALLLICSSEKRIGDKNSMIQLKYRKNNIRVFSLQMLYQKDFSDMPQNQGPFGDPKKQLLF